MSDKKFKSMPYKEKKRQEEIKRANEQKQAEHWYNFLKSVYQNKQNTGNQ